MQNATAATHAEYVYRLLPSGIEFAANVLPRRETVALTFRMLTGLMDEPDECNGIGAIVENTLSKGTAKFDGRGLADAFDRLGAQWSSGCGRQSMLVRVLCLPEYTADVVALVAEMLAHPTFPDEACSVAVDLAQQSLRHLEDEPQDLLRIAMHRLMLGPVLGRFVGGTIESLARITPEHVRAHWRRCYHAGRLQVSVAGAVDVDALSNAVETRLGLLGSSERAGRAPAEFDPPPARVHRHKDLEQEHIALAMPGLTRDDPDFAVEQVLIGVLAGGMSGRLFTEVREKQGLVYWVGAWHEQPRGRGAIHLGASTTPERCDRTFETLLMELRRIGDDLRPIEVERARDSLISQYETEDDLTRARAASLSDDLFHFGRIVGRAARIEALRRVTHERVLAYAQRLPLERLCVGTLGPRELHG